MRCVAGIDLGSTTTKAVLLDEAGEVVGRGITNSRSNYEVACGVAHEEALAAARMSLVRRTLLAMEGPGAPAARRLAGLLDPVFRLESYRAELLELRREVLSLLAPAGGRTLDGPLEPAARQVMEAMEAGAPRLFFASGGEVPRRSDFFRDLAGAEFVAAAEGACATGEAPFERLVGLFDRAILNVETRLFARDFEGLLRRGTERVAPETAALLEGALREAAGHTIDEVAFVGTGYGRQTLPFPKQAVRSEILCHGRGAHRVFPGTRTVLDIGGQDTKAVQVDGQGVVTSFQMNDRCAAGCGRYLGYIADELNLGLHELGPLALQSEKTVRVNSTCTVFAGAELRERLALGQKREDILAGLHRAIMLRAMSLLARSGGVRDQFSFTGGVCKNPMAVKVLRELMVENYGDGITLNIHPDSIYMGALGAALFALDDLRAGKPGILPRFGAERTRPDDLLPPCGRNEPAERRDGAAL
jgi:benzoyl-CoA reductase subunit A